MNIAKNKRKKAVGSCYPFAYLESPVCSSCCLSLLPNPLLLLNSMAMHTREAVSNTKNLKAVRAQHLNRYLSWCLRFRGSNV